MSAEPVAVVGMSCLFPGAGDLQQFWANIVDKVDAVGDAPAGSWDPALHYDPEFTDQDKVYTRRGGYLGDLATFDPLPHGIPPVAVGGEPDQWLALQLARDALADAGCLDLPDDVRARAGVMLGKGTYLNGGNAIAVQRSLVLEQTVALLQRLRPGLRPEQVDRLRAELKQVLPPLGPETVPGLIPNVIVGRIANRLDFMGPTYTVDGACASSLIAVQLAVGELRRGSCDLVVAGGSQVWMPVPALNVFCRLGALSRSERIRPFDAAADGTLLGEGIGMVVLKRLADARRDGDRVYAVVRGVGVASDGRGAGVMAPRVDGEELALRRAYLDAEVDPGTVGLIEAHGTATPVGDVVEIAALRRVFGGRRGPLGTVALGSVKSMISHTIPAAGIAGLIKTALALHHRVLPPTLHVTTPNPKLELESTPFYLNTETRPWVHGGPEPRRAGVNAFGFGGINAHAVLEETSDPVTPELRQPWDCELVVVEGASRAELVTRTQQLLHQVRVLDAPLVDVAATLAARVGRAATPVRLAVVATSLEQLATRLEWALGRLAEPDCHRIHGVSGTFFAERPLGREGTLAFLFPGEGAQYAGMLGDLCRQFPEVREAFDRAERRRAGGSLPSPGQAVFPPPAFTAAERAEADARLVEMDTAIEAVLTANEGLLALTRRLGVLPASCAGHSSGEYSAAVASGLLGAEDEHSVAALVAALRDSYAAAQAADELPRGVLLSLGASREATDALVRRVGPAASVAMDNCPHQTVVVAATSAAGAVESEAAALGLVCERLSYDRAVHTPAFAPYAHRLRGVLERFPVRSARTALWSCAAAAPYPDQPDDVRLLFAGQWAAPVEFRTMVERMWESGTRAFLEVGPRGNLSAFVEDILRGREFCAIPLDTSRRSGTRQLNLAVGMLAVHDLPVAVPALFAGRAQCVDDAVLEQRTAAPSRPGRPLATGWPSLLLDDAAVQRVGSLPSPVEGEPPDQVAPAEPDGSTPGAVLDGVDGGWREAAGPAADPEPVLDGHFATMSRFLTVAEEVLAAYFGERVPAAFPLLGEVVAEDPGVRLIARRVLDPQTDGFLVDHSFGGPVSDRDPALLGLAPVPLALSLEIMAEAAARLMSGVSSEGLVVVGLREVRAHRWLASDGSPRTVQATADRLPGDERPVAVAVSLRFADEAGAGAAVEGVVLLDGAYPPARPALDEPEDAPVSRWAGAELYGASGMFHGATWQGVQEVQRCGARGATATLVAVGGQVCRLPDGLLLDPVTLDAAGQVVGFWAAEQLSGGAVVFPVGLDELSLHDRPAPAGSELRCVSRSAVPHPDLVVSDLEVRTPDGRVVLRMSGWADKRFSPLPGFADLLRQGRPTLSYDFREPLAGLGAAGDALTLRRLDADVTEDAAFWSAVWASRLQGGDERTAWAGRTGPVARGIEHLAGRAAAKDAVATFAHPAPPPADIEILADGSGRPVVRWDGPAVTVSIAHVRGVALALAGGARDPARLGIDVERRGARAPAFAASAFSPAEADLLDGPDAEDWALRFWCAKEAVGKALGLGLPEGPGSAAVVAVDRDSGRVSVRLRGRLRDSAPDLADAAVLVATWADDDVVIATTMGAPAPEPRPLAAEREAGHA